MFEKAQYKNPIFQGLISQLILQPSRCFTYVTAHSPTLLSLFLRHRLFTYVTWRASHDIYNWIFCVPMNPTSYVLLNLSDNNDTVIIIVVITSSDTDNIHNELFSSSKTRETAVPGRMVVYFYFSEINSQALISRKLWEDKVSRSRTLCGVPVTDCCRNVFTNIRRGITRTELKVVKTCYRSCVSASAATCWPDFSLWWAAPPPCV